MANWSNCDRKSQLAGNRTEPLNRRDSDTLFKVVYRKKSWVTEHDR